jgi:hypothetical protein
MSSDSLVYHMEYDKHFLLKAVECAFHYIELMDHTVGAIYACPDLMKEIVMEFSKEVKFDYVYQGIGLLRTAHLKYLPSAKENGIVFINQLETFKLKIILI